MAGQELARIQAHHKESLTAAHHQIQDAAAAAKQKLEAEESEWLARWKSSLKIASELSRISRERLSSNPGWEEMFA